MYLVRSDAALEINLVNAAAAVATADGTTVRTKVEPTCGTVAGVLGCPRARLLVAQAERLGEGLGNGALGVLLGGVSLLPHALSRNGRGVRPVLP